MKAVRVLIFAVGIALVVLPAIAQVPTGTLTGRVDDGKAALPGVTVTVSSISLQGMRNAVTSINGDYIFSFLPAGDYNIKFELHGFQTVDTTVKLSAAQTSTVNATMPQTKIAEEVTVTGAYETISSSAQAAATVTFELLNKLPIGAGNINNYAALTPGTTSTGPGNALTISGAQSFENLFMVNGVNVQDNIRLTPLNNLFIEDAVQETTTQTAAISAEYGRFSGGVVNMLTKSGGNDVHGSFRLAFDTGDSGGKWSTREPLRTGILSDTINRSYIATLGGYFLKDKLWYFIAYRNQNQTTGSTTWITNLPFNAVDIVKRYEGKLTYSINPSHRVIGSYNKVDEEQDGNVYQRVMDYASLVNRTLPEDLVSANYTGILSDNFFLEGQFSQRKFTFQNSGSLYRDLIKGTLLIDYWRAGSSAYRFNAPTFCGICDPEKRDNREYLAKASYFLSTAGAGTHDLVGGVDVFDDKRFSNNYQSGSDWRIYGYSIVRNGVVYPRFIGDGSTWAYWTPIFVGSQGNDFQTQSAFINDKWRLNTHLSFSLGVRYDKNHGEDATGHLTAKDSKVSPRLAMTFDPKGDADMQFNASYAVYVDALANSQGDSASAGGQPATIEYDYYGPNINADVNAPTSSLIDSATAIQMFFNWLNSVGGTGTTDPKILTYFSLPGQNIFIPNGLVSPNAREYTVGMTKRFGTRGMARFDYVNRSYHDFYVSETDTITGKVTVVFQGANKLLDKTIVKNDDSFLKRKYNALQFQGQYRPLDSLNIGGNWTISKAEGNFVGETATSGPVSTGILSYPEYWQRSWSYSYGNLPIDQRHKVRLWAVWDLLNGKHNHLSASLLHSYFSGTPYGANGTIDTRTYVTSPGYVTVPSSVGYWFTPRDAYLSGNVQRTDFALNYAFTVPALGTQLQFFVEPKVVNVFDRSAVLTPNTAVYTARNSGKNLAKFDPFHTSPIECQHASSDGASCLDHTGTYLSLPQANWMVAPTFGTPQAATDYQQPRTFYVSLGVRF